MKERGLVLTEFGKAARKWRIDRGQKLRDMACALGVSVAYLSAIETGRKPLGADTPIVTKLPVELRRVVYAETIKMHDAARARICALLANT